MRDDEILDVIRSAVRAETGDHDTAITTETVAADVQGWDSLAHGRIVLTIEVELSIRINIDKTYAASNIGELLSVVRKALTQSGR